MRLGCVVTAVMVDSDNGTARVRILIKQVDHLKPAGHLKPSPLFSYRDDVPRIRRRSARD
jgi:hypothetical protein